MKKTIFISALIVAISLGFASVANAQGITCDDIVFAPEVLADNPNIGDACLDVVEKNGQTAAKYHARVVRQTMNSTIVQWKLPDGSWSAAQRRFPAKNAIAEMGNQGVAIADLAARTEVNVYLPMSAGWTVRSVETMAAAEEEVSAPPPPPPPPPAPEPVEETAPVVLPTTATQVPAFALLGGLLLLLGGAVSFVRMRL